MANTPRMAASRARRSPVPVIILALSASSPEAVIVSATGRRSTPFRATAAEMAVEWREPAQPAASAVGSASGSVHFI
ncbi:hypothetical protein [Ancylobacter defluvii]|uniref:hypothetical protein n=1 Tax=Ancylobacter defluvii TaxID=1282440 RepID=UPI001BD16765|nr:hypothetical protein [Ancylobacter defluvii]MBS7586858.1 hypothetical protein [Ancylobacter defluvii]